MKTFTQYITEAKDRIIKKMPNLSKEEKEILVPLFKTNDKNREKLVDWNRWKTLTFDDFKAAIAYESKSSKKKAVKSKGIKGLAKGKDYIDVSYMFNNYYAYLPLNHKASKFIASKYIGTCTAKWCTAENNSRYWTAYVGDGIRLMYLVNSDEGADANKFAIAYLPDDIMNSYEIFDENDHVVSAIPNENIISILRRYDKDLKEYGQKVEKSVPEWLERATTYRAKWSYTNGVVSWNEGRWQDGEWESGVWHKGVFENGIWRTGTWLSGEWENGYWFDGIWRGGVWKDGLWYYGIWKGGTWEGGRWKDGVWHKGTWKDGIWWDGIWMGGTWEGGEWRGGSDRYGNEHPRGDSPDKWIN